jgi:predicted component of type VI protein secretion system
VGNPHNNGCAMKFKLKVTAGSLSGKEIALKEGTFLIGRSKECDLRASSELVSRRHCEFVFESKSLRVRDLSSKNGTFVNGVRIEEERELVTGDQLQVGPLRFEVIGPSLGKASEEPAPKVPEVAAPPSKSPSISKTAAPSARENDYADDISQWLEEPTATVGRSDGTDNGSLDDTRHVGSSSAKTTDSLAAGKVSPQAKSSVNEEKKKPGKLPPVPTAQTRNSGEAAENMLKGLPRRR